MKRLTLRLPEELHQLIRKQSFETGKSMNEIIVDIIGENYKKKGKKNNDER